MSNSINPANQSMYDRIVGSILSTAQNAGRYYRNTPSNERGVLDFIEKNHDGSLAQAGDPVQVPQSQYRSLNNGNRITGGPMMPTDGNDPSLRNPQIDPEVVTDGSVIENYLLNNNLAMKTQPILENTAEPASNQGILANPIPQTGNRRDQTPMSFKPQTIDNNEMLIRMGLAGLGANSQGATASLGAMGDMYGAIQDTNRSALNSYNLAMQKAEAKAKGKEKKQGDAGNLYGSIVVNDAIDRGLPMINKLTAGFGGSLLSKIPGTDATDLTKLIDSVKANAGFDKLQAMREASPTGGALGQVSDKEIRFLQSVFGSLDQDQSPEQLKYNLELFRYVYNSMIHGEGNHPYSPPAGADAMINQMRGVIGGGSSSIQPAAAGNLSAADAIVGIN